MSEPRILDDGRVCLPQPTAEALARAAEEVLGPTAPEAPFNEGGKVFRGMGGFFLQGPDESAGVMLAQADRELQDRLMAEAAKVRAFREEQERAKYLDPKTNPLFRRGD